MVEHGHIAPSLSYRTDGPLNSQDATEYFLFTPRTFQSTYNRINQNEYILADNTNAEYQTLRFMQNKLLNKRDNTF
jgi:hypothetical protein